VRPRLLLALLLAGLALAAAGCGVGPGESKSGAVELRVTRDFGQQEIGSPETKKTVSESDTVMRFLQSKRKITTRFGGAFVQSIDGVSGSKAGEHDWFFYVNGSEASVGAADYSLNAGDVVQWDFHRWTATQHVPAVVGAYPEPFLHGMKGKKMPTRLECEEDSSEGCQTVRDRLSKQGVIVTNSVLGAQTQDTTLRVIVAKWDKIRQLFAGRVLNAGPQQSGVFARFAKSGGALELLDGSGDVARESPPGTGLLAATQPEGQAITWLVTGADDEGVTRAAQALDPGKLRGAFAVAAEPDGLVRLPVGGD
jgi:hypothetical protein